MVAEKYIFSRSDTVMVLYVLLYEEKSQSDLFLPIPNIPRSDIDDYFCYNSDMFESSKIL